MALLPWGQRGTAAVSIASGLNLEHLVFNYDQERRVIDDISVEIGPGEIICLLGKSGSGKTTLLSLVAGLESPSSGRILIDRREVAGPDFFVPAEKRGIGFVFQDYALFPHLTLRENVCFGLHSLSRKDGAAVAERALARVGLAGYGKAYPHQISGGEQQRVALARAVAPRPPMLLMDEPFSGLDLALREEVRQETLAVIRETRATSIIVTHDPEEALRLADRIALLRDGKMIQIGKPREIFLDPATLDSARFFGEINVIEAAVTEGQAITPLGKYHVPPKLSQNARVLMTFRPAALQIAEEKEGFVGRIVTSHFLGDRQLSEVVISGLEHPITLACHPALSLEKGKDINLSLPSDGVHFFPA